MLLYLQIKAAEKVRMELKILHWFEELHNPVLDFLMYQIPVLETAD